jgi:HK97 family phage portal protein
MGLGRLLETRSTVINTTDTVTGATATFTIIDNLGPDYQMMGPWRGAMSIPGAWRASVLLSDLLGQVPWEAWREPAGEVPERVTPTPPLLEQPYPPDSSMTSFSSWGLDLIWEGNALGLIASRNSQGWPTSAIPVPARMVSVRRITKYSDSPLPVGALEYAIGSLRVGSDEVIHVKGPCEPGAVRGMGVLEAHMNTFNLAQEQSQQARSVSQHGVPTGILESSDPDMDEDGAAELKTAWLAAQRSRTIAVLNSSTKFTPLSWNPEQLQLVEARKFTLGELELIFGLPVGWLGGMTSARQYSNIEQDAINLLRFSLGGHVSRFEEAFSLAFPRGTKVRANWAAFQRPDTKTRYETYKIGVDGGFLDPDEIRLEERKKPLPKPEKPEMNDDFRDPGDDDPQAVDKPVGKGQPPRRRL